MWTYIILSKGSEEGGKECQYDWKERKRGERRQRREEGSEACAGRRYLCTMYTSGHTTIDRRVGGVGFRI